MATTNAVTGTNAADALASTQGTSALRNTGGSLGKDDFLKLLVGQMKNMDPLGAGGKDPSDTMAQMTQYSMLEQLTNLSNSTQSLAQQNKRASTISLIGHTVSYSKEDGTPAEGVVERVETAGANVTLTIGGTPGINPDNVLQVR
jgi:flagellar basal-body rod modification protein FlgD